MAFSTLSFQALSLILFTLTILIVSLIRKKRNYWYSRAIPVAKGQSVLSTLPVCRLNEKHLTSYRNIAIETPIVGLHDAGKPCVLICDVQAASIVLSNDGFVEDTEISQAHTHSKIPNVITEDNMQVVMPAMAECVKELAVSLEGLANRKMTIAPWAALKRCASNTVATCVYGETMIDSRMKAFEELCNVAMKYEKTQTAGKHLISYENALSANCIKTMLCKAANIDIVDDEIRMDMFTFVTKAIEPTAALVTATLYELSQNSRIQSQLRNQLDEVLDEDLNNLTIEQLDRIPYLDSVIHETLRKYPLMPVIRCIVTKPYSIQTKQKTLTIEPGVVTLIPVHAYHHDKIHFTNPETFHPNRFPGQLSSAYIPYGSGPQSYIGKHFIGLEAKMIVAILLSKYEFTVDKRNPGKAPNPFDKSSFSEFRVQLSSRMARNCVMEQSLQELSKKNKLFKLF
ncbi:probable cytochrome P450 6a18 [Daktulosphaira vitifoliae]|uniref:probable cytochrome P450 6a18 n=1 Tax=Daktulosphaira vitifoliae TaxID=58002 RepID=UPI0021A9C680|nr:probable cytochrome P450 6a18 [Daktulosphaira vitifoliae]XP_050522630.1 probable cytochrome P450 6a18 [Daktulosphaira vitifoliae]